MFLPLNKDGKFRRRQTLGFHKLHVLLVKKCTDIGFLFSCNSVCRMHKSSFLQMNTLIPLHLSNCSIKLSKKLRPALTPMPLALVAFPIFGDVTILTQETKMNAVYKSR